MSERPWSVYEDHVGHQQHDDEAVAQCDQSAVPLWATLGEGATEEDVETQPANQAADDLHYRHRSTPGENYSNFINILYCSLLYYTSYCTYRIVLLSEWLAFNHQNVSG